MTPRTPVARDRQGLLSVLSMAAAAAVVVMGLLPAVASASTPQPPSPSTASPSQDPFYKAPAALGNLSPGTVIRSRAVSVPALGVAPALPASQVLYRTQNQLGRPTATVATIIAPTVQVKPQKLLSYQTFYDGVASTCRPSYTLQGGSPGNAQGVLDGSLINAYVAQGYTVVTSDYEGPTDDYGAGREAGYGTLDAIRAAENQLKLPRSTPVGLIGYSGGATASEWASQLQPSYAPGLSLIGVAEGGIPVDFTHNLDYINGSDDWSGAIPAILVGLGRAYDVRLSTYLSPYGQQTVAQVKKGCLNPSGFPGLTFEKMLKPQYKDWKTVPIFRRIFNDSIMGRTGAPSSPLLMAVGNSDGTGDGVMVAGDVQQLAYQYCRRGVAVQLNVYPGANHYAAAGVFEPQAVAFFSSLYSGQAAINGCSSIAPGNPLTPLPGGH